MVSVGTPREDEVIDSTLERIERLDPPIGAFTEVLHERARATVERRSGSARTPLGGVPVGVKELFAVRGALHECGSHVRAAQRADADAVAVRRLSEAGAVVVGMTRSHEFAWGITTQHRDRGSTRNPRNLDLVPGGSSGGSAAAVAAGLVPLALGTDTGGSIRIPAAFCGVLGLKTSWGIVPTTGCCPLAPSFDTIGLLGSDADVLQRGWAALSGLPVVSQAPTFRFAVPPGLQPRPLSARRAAALELVTDTLRALGGEAVDVPDVDTHDVSEMFVPQIMAEARFVHSVQLGTWPERHDQYGRDVAARLRAAESVDLRDLLAARSMTKDFVERLMGMFRTADVLVNIVGVTGPSRVEDPNHVDVEGRRVALLDATMPSTLPQNLAGVPSLTVPVGRDVDGVPVGVQLTGRPWSEHFLLHLGRRLERFGALAHVGGGNPIARGNAVV